MVESDRARRSPRPGANLADLPTVDGGRGPGGDRAGPPPVTGPVDLVVLDPPRSGAGAAVVRAIAAAGPRAVAYVACDPAAFARDVAHLRRAAAGG